MTAAVSIVAGLRDEFFKLQPGLVEAAREYQVLTTLREREEDGGTRMLMTPIVESWKRISELVEKIRAVDTVDGMVELFVKNELRYNLLHYSKAHPEGTSAIEISLKRVLKRF